MLTDPDESNPDEFKLFYEMLMRSAPEGYTPHLFKCRSGGKEPYGAESWTSKEAVLSFEEATEWLKTGGNIGIAGTNEDRLVVVDIDNEDIVDYTHEKQTLTCRTSSRCGVHLYYFETEPGLIPNKDVDIEVNKEIVHVGELRTDRKYVIVPGSWAEPEDPDKEEDKVKREKLKAQRAKLDAKQTAFLGSYTLEITKPAVPITSIELPLVFRQKIENDMERVEEQRKANEDQERRKHETPGKQSRLFDLTIRDVITKAPRDGTAFPSPFHPTKTGHNTTISCGLVHCWRHSVCLNPIQALCVLSGYLSCEEAGTPHRGGAGCASAVVGNDRAIWEAWKYAKQTGLIPANDPIPTAALKHVSISNNLCKSENIKDGWKIPLRAYNASLELVKNEGIDPGRELKTGIKHREKPKEEPVKEIDEESLEFLKDPDLFNLTTEIELDKQIVGEIDTRKTIFLCACGSFVENAQIASYNLMVNSGSGAGKDWVLSHTLKILPKKCYVKRTRITEKAFTYWHDSIKEPWWTWDGKVFYYEDITNRILNSDVFRVMCSTGSTVTVVKDQIARDIEIKGKPVIIVSSAKATLTQEMERRFTLISCDETIDQTEAIMDRQAENAENMGDTDFDSRISGALGFLKRVRVKIPYAKAIRSFLPKGNIVMRTHFQRLLDYIKASTALYQNQRERDENGNVIATGDDYDIAVIAFKKITSNPRMITLTKNKQRILQIFKDFEAQTLEKKKYSVKELEAKVTFINLPQLYIELNELTENNFLEKDKEKKEGSDKLIMVFSLVESSNELKIPEWKDIKERCENTINPIKGINAIKRINTINPNAESQYNKKHLLLLIKERFTLKQKNTTIFSRLRKKELWQLWQLWQLFHNQKGKIEVFTREAQKLSDQNKDIEYFKAVIICKRLKIEYPDEFLNHLIQDGILERVGIDKLKILKEIVDNTETDQKEWGEPISVAKILQKNKKKGILHIEGRQQRGTV